MKKLLTILALAFAINALAETDGYIKLTDRLWIEPDACLFKL